MSIAEIALSGLLHDIGKFSQRAHHSDHGLSEQSKGMAPSICPSWQGRSTHLHVLYTNEFVENLSFLPDGINQVTVANLASYHHRPDTDEQNIITIADRLSSGMEREPDEAVEGRPMFRRVRMQSVATTVSFPDSQPVPPACLPLSAMSPQAAFPLMSPDADQDLTAEYADLWQKFRIAWETNHCRNSLGFINRATSILEQFTWCIPSATNAIPDISLFDHMKTTSAIAVCLSLAGQDATEPFLLVAGDLAGIQRYIFDIHQGAGGLARRLRARSFNVATFVEAVSLDILGRLELPITHRILFAGGKFHLLLPNTPQVLDVLDQVSRESSAWLFNMSGGEVSLTLAHLPFAEDGLSDFARTVTQLNARLRVARCHCGKTIFQAASAWNESAFLLPAMDIPEPGGICECCGKQGGRLREVHGKEVPVCDRCSIDEDIGRSLPATRYVVFHDNEHGRYAVPCGSIDLVTGNSKLPESCSLAVDLDGVGEGPENLPVIGSYRARHVPVDRDTGHVVLFEDLAESAVGRPALACLKMDVDNLGFIFSHGLKQHGGAGARENGESPAHDRASISRIATLSRSLELFFSGFLEALLRDEFSDVYLVYSGGDDVAAIGPWNRIFDLAERIRAEFARFTANNPAWSLSAGIFLMTAHVPVLSAMAEAENLLDASKHAKGDGVIPWPQMEPTDGAVTKDRLTVFGTSIPWAEYPGSLARARQVVRWLEDKVINTGKVRRLLNYAEMHREFQRTGDTRHLQYAPLLARDLRRNWDEKTKDQQEAKQWAARLAVPGSDEMKLMRFIAEYALYSVRGS